MNLDELRALFEDKPDQTSEQPLVTKTSEQSRAADILGGIDDSKALHVELEVPGAGGALFTLVKFSQGTSQSDVCKSLADIAVVYGGWPDGTRVTHRSFGSWRTKRTEYTLQYKSAYNSLTRSVATALITVIDSDAFTISMPNYIEP